MSILVDENSRIIVQGFGRAGQFHAGQCMEYGSKIVGAVHPGKGGSDQLGVPVFNTVQQAIAKVQPNASILS
jgi:succinyl-CoA synthetase alpha subunit